MANPIVAWPGGKRRLAKQIISHIPPHTCYVEPFCGAGGVFFRKPPSKSEILNDLNGDLVNLYRIVQHHPEEFTRQFKWTLFTRKTFEEYCSPHQVGLTDIQRAARFYYLQQTAYGAKVGGRYFAPSPSGPSRFNVDRIPQTVAQAYQRLRRVSVDHRPWADCIKRYDRAATFFYIDPPYLISGIKGFYGMEFTADDHKALAVAVGKVKGKAIISINDSQQVRAIYKGFRVEELSTTYSMSPAASRPAVTELLLFNW